MLMPMDANDQVSEDAICHSGSPEVRSVCGERDALRTEVVLLRKQLSACLSARPSARRSQHLPSPVAEDRREHTAHARSGFRGGEGKG